MDEQPVALKTQRGSMVSIPYTVEINDVVISAVQQQPSDEILRRGCDQSTGFISRAGRRRG